MNKATIDHLKNNPHYKVSPQQEEEAEEDDENPMISFGRPNLHDTRLPIHPTGPQRKSR